MIAIQHRLWRVLIGVGFCGSGITGSARAGTTTPPGAPVVVQTSRSVGLNESVRYAVVNGVPTLTSYQFTGGAGSGAVYQARQVNGTWTASAVPGTSGANSGTSVTIGGTTYVGIVSGNTNGVQVFSNASGSFRLEYADSAPTGQGGFMELANVDGQPVAVYAGAAPLGSAYSYTVDTLARSAAGTWAEQVTPLFIQPGIVRLSPLEVGGNLDVLIGNAGGGGTVLATRAGGAWTTQTFANLQSDFGATLVAVNGLADFATTPGPFNLNKVPAFDAVQPDGSRAVTTLGGSNTFAEGVDAELINGVVTVAYADINSGTLHLRRWLNGAFSDQVVDTGVTPQSTDGVAVFAAADGNVGLSYYTNTASAIELRYVEVAVPEPTAAAVATAVAGGVLARRRRS